MRDCSSTPDLWPNLILGAKASGTRLALVNARMSQRSFEGWRWAKNTIGAMLSAFDVCLAQDDEIAARFRILGAPDVRVVGSLKADAPPLPYDAAKLVELQAADRCATGAAGGADASGRGRDHPAGARRAAPDVPQPAHHRRAAPSGARSGYFHAVRRAPIGAARGRRGITSETAVYIADTMGELGLFYRLAPFAFVGGTLVPMGGHNPLEPARLGCAVMAGPHTFNSVTAYAAIFAAQGLGQVQSSTDVAALAGRLFDDPDLAKSLGEAATRGASALGGAMAQDHRRGRHIPGRTCGRLISGRARISCRRPWCTILTPFGWLYGASVAYRASHSHPYQAACHVLCIGNLTAGGTGKTPIAIAIGKALIARGAKPVFLTRGYGGKVRGPAFVTADDRATHVGDEPLLLATVAPVIVSADRAAGARLAEENGFDTIVMDDGLQNFSLAKDLSVVVIDAVSAFGNGRILPAGPLREPVAQGLKRTQAVILNGLGPVPALPRFDGSMLRAKVEQTGPSLRGRRVVAFAGIGRPSKFFEALAAQGARIVEQRGYSDHHVYTQSEVARMKARARAENGLLVTTEKDYVRLTPAERDGIVPLPVEAVFEDPAALDALLDRLTRRRVPPLPT